MVKSKKHKLYEKVKYFSPSKYSETSKLKDIGGLILMTFVMYCLTYLMFLGQDNKAMYRLEYISNGICEKITSRNIEPLQQMLRNLFIAHNNYQGSTDGFELIFFGEELE